MQPIRSPDVSDRLPSIVLSHCDLNGMEALGRRLAECCRPGDAIALKGDLGAGKTTLARAFIRHAMGSDVEVASPTFTLVQNYSAPSGELYHFDLYRLEKPGDLHEIGLEDALDNGICLIEWPDLAEQLLPIERITVTIAHGARESERNITVTGTKQLIETLSMHARDTLIREFLVHHGHAAAQREPIPGDASFRRYERIRQDGRSFILMDAPPGKEDVRPFVTVARYLTGNGFSAPRVLAEDAEQGLLLLEDLGNDLYTRLLRQDASPAYERELYAAAIDALRVLHGTAYDALPVPAYTLEKLVEEALLLVDWFLPQIATDNIEQARKEYVELWRAVLPVACESVPRVAVLRDYHADNLLWLPERDGIARVGLLDFQDALIGPASYDLVSLLEDARRDVRKDSVEHCLTRYMDGMTEAERQRFLTSYAVMGAQRNCKIVGIFVRLAVRDGKPHYLKFLPRVWGHLAHDLAHPLLTPMKEWMDRYVAPQFRGEIAVRR